MKRKYVFSSIAVVGMAFIGIFFQNASVPGSSYDCTNYSSIPISGLGFDLFSGSYHCRGPEKDLNIVEADINMYHVKAGKPVVCSYYTPRMSSDRVVVCKNQGVPLMAPYSGVSGKIFPDLYTTMNFGSANVSTGFYASCFGSAFVNKSKVIDFESPEPTIVTLRYICQYKGGQRGLSPAQNAAYAHSRIKNFMEAPRKGGRVTDLQGRILYINDIGMICSPSSLETVCEAQTSITVDPASIPVNN